MRSILCIIACWLAVGVNSQSIYRVYKPIRNNLVGWAVAYNKKTMELSPRLNKLDSLVTSICSESYDRYVKKTNIDIIVVNRKVGRITTIEALGNVYIDQAYILKPPVTENAPFIHSGLRADSFKITYVKDASTSVNPIELAEAIANAYGVDISWLKIKWIDSINHTFKDSLSIIVKNPSVYYQVEIATLKHPGVNWHQLSWAQRKLHPEWFRSFNSDDALNQKPIFLTPNSDSMSVSLETIGVNPACKVTLFVKENAFGGLELGVITNFDNYKAIYIKPNIANSWNITDFSLGLFNVSSNIYVELKVDIKARIVGNSIKISESYLTYPSYTLTNSL